MDSRIFFLYHSKCKVSLDTKNIIENKGIDKIEILDLANTKIDGDFNITKVPSLIVNDKLYEGQDNIINFLGDLSNNSKKGNKKSRGGLYNNLPPPAPADPDRPKPVDLNK